jgi:hypothetical protein
MQDRGGLVLGPGEPAVHRALIDVVPVERAIGERAIGGDGGDRTVDLVEQGAGLGAVVGIAAGQRRRDDPAGVGVRGQVQFAP